MDAPAVTIGSASADTTPESPISLNFLDVSNQLGSLGRLAKYEITRIIG